MEIYGRSISEGGTRERAVCSVCWEEPSDARTVTRASIWAVVQVTES